ncbi:uncharacterized protein O3C94_005997 isoform 2-T4 [Discoglossus pictus]
MARCVVNGCNMYKTKHRINNGQHVTLHGFPKSTALIKIWLQQTGQDFGDIDAFVDKVKSKNTYYRICSWHFTADSYYCRGIQKKLKPHAIPTIFKRNGPVCTIDDTGQYVQTALHPQVGEGGWRPHVDQGASHPQVGQGAWRPQVAEGPWQPQMGQGAWSPQLAEGAWHPHIGQTQVDPIISEADHVNSSFSIVAVGQTEEPSQTTSYPQVIKTEVYPELSTLDNSIRTVPIGKEEDNKGPAETILQQHFIKNEVETENDITNSIGNVPISEIHIKEEPVETNLEIRVIKTNVELENDTTNSIGNVPICEKQIKEEPVEITLDTQVIKTEVVSIGSEIEIETFNYSIGPDTNTEHNMYEINMEHNYFDKSTVPPKPGRKPFANAATNTDIKTFFEKTTSTRPYFGFKNVSTQTGVKLFTNTTGTCTIEAKKSDVGMWTGQLYQDGSTSTAGDVKEMDTCGGTGTQTDPFKCTHCKKKIGFGTTQGRRKCHLQQT